MRGFHRICVLLLPVLLLTSGIPLRCAADEGPVSANADLFENDVVADNVFGLRMATRSLPVEARYEILKSHVLPGKLHREFRLFGKLTSTDPPESTAYDHPVDVARIEEGINRKQKRIRTGGILVSPVFDLIAAAKEAGKLNELRFAVQAATATEEVQQRCQLSLLAMIAIAKGDLADAARSADELHQRFVNQRFDRLQDRMPETLFLWMAAEHGVLLDEALQFLVSILESQIRVGKSSGPTEWNVLMIHLMGWIQHHKLPPEQRTQPWTAAPDLKSWHPVTRKNSWTNGLGLPPGHIQTSDGSVDVLAKMDDEFLLFTSPLRGNYTLECLCTCFGWKEIHPFINGWWITPLYNHESVQVGEMYRVGSDVKMNPKLSRVDNRLRYRVDVRDGFCSRYINSRLISREPLPKDHDPWVAFRNPGSGMGHISNVRITGEPVIPDEVRISELRSQAWRDADKLAKASNSTQAPVRRPISHLLGWVTWFDDPWNPERLSWKVESDDTGMTQLVGQHLPELSGIAAERLLRYVWPLVWDSEVTYEFFYEDGKSIVHPALGLQAFLLEPSAVSIHDVTNGAWEEARLDRLNQSAAGNRISMESLPLKSGEWNRMTVEIAGDVIRLRLNEIIIYESDIAVTNDRTFGLFHYCDQSDARVRNVVLKGDWPKTVPPVAEQELRGTETDTLDSERIALPDSFEFKFTNRTEEELQSEFVIADEKRQRDSTRASDTLSSVIQLLNKPDWDVFLEPDGLHMRGEAGPKANSTSSVGPRVKISGDFDVIAEFSDLRIKPSDNGVAAIYLGPRVILKELEAHLLFRGIVQHPNTPLRELTQVELLRSGAKGFRYEYPAIYADECRSGRLRVARRGTKFHYLIAPLDSENFRLLHSIDGPDIPIMNGNFLVRTSCYSQGVESSQVSVVWKNISIRAESIEHNRTSGLRNLYLLDLRKVDPVGSEEKKAAVTTEAIRQLAAANEEYTQTKWPTWSHDGGSIVFEQNNGQYSLLTSLSLDDSQMYSLAIGTLPGLSPDGSQIVVTQEGRGLSIHSMRNFNGAAHDLDPDGQSGTWSPDGRLIAWIARKRIVVYDVKTQQRRILPPEVQSSPYRAIEKGLGWSRDSKSLAFKASLTKDQGNAVAIVALDLDKPDKPDVLYTGVRLHSDVSWHPDGNQVLFSGLDPSTGTPQMFIVKRNAPEKLIPVTGQPRDWRIIDCEWSPDGHQIVFTAEPPL